MPDTSTKQWFYAALEAERESWKDRREKKKRKENIKSKKKNGTTKIIMRTETKMKSIQVIEKTFVFL